MLTHACTHTQSLTRIMVTLFAVIQIFVQITWVAIDQQCGAHKPSSIWDPPRTQPTT